MTGDKSRVFNIDNFDKLGDIVESVKRTTCKGQYRINTRDSSAQFFKMSHLYVVYLEFMKLIGFSFSGQTTRSCRRCVLDSS